MSVITQMTLYGVYDLKYFRKGQTTETRHPKSSSPLSAAQTYKAASAPFYLKNILWGRGVAVQADDYKKQMASAFVVSRKLAEQSEQFAAEQWPRLKVTDSEIVRGQAQNSAADAGYDIEVADLASRHAFASKPLWLDREDLADTGVYAVNLANGKQKEKAIFYLDKQDNARGVMKKAADAINAFSSMAKARVLEDGGAVRLLVSSELDGAAGRFSLSDDTGGLLEKLGVSLLEKGGDGLAVINGQPHILTNNFLHLGDAGLDLEFLRKGKERVKIEPDSEAATAAVKDLFGAYNDFRELFNGSDNKTSRANEMLRAFDAIFQQQKEMMPGLWQDENGRIGLLPGTDALPVAQNIASERWGLASTMYNMAAGVLKNPINSYLSTAMAAVSFPSEFNGLLLDIVA